MKPNEHQVCPWLFGGDMDSTGVWITGTPGGWGQTEGSERSRAQQNSAEGDLFLQIIPSDRVSLGLKAPAAGNSLQVFFSILTSQPRIDLLCHVVCSWEPVPVHSPRSSPQRIIKVLAHSPAAPSFAKLPLCWCKGVQKLAATSHLDRAHELLCYVDVH